MLSICETHFGDIQLCEQPKIYRVTIHEGFSQIATCERFEASKALGALLKFFESDVLVLVAVLCCTSKHPSAFCLSLFFVFFVVAKRNEEMSLAREPL